LTNKKLYWANLNGETIHVHCEYKKVHTTNSNYPLKDFKPFDEQKYNTSLQYQTNKTEKTTAKVVWKSGSILEICAWNCWH
jgi:hypothetical protein